jgi:hypothetical protein
VNLKDAFEVLGKGGLVRLPEWPKHQAVRGVVKPRLVHAKLTSTGAPYVMEVGAYSALHDETHAKRDDFERVSEETLRSHAVKP